MSRVSVARFKGFSLVEIAVVLVIVGLLLGGLMIPISAQMDLRDYNNERKSMEQINAALLGFAMVNGYLPCPAISSAIGTEDRTGTVCSGTPPKNSGFLPWSTLGLPKLDSWGHLYKYSVGPGYASSAAKITFTLPTVDNMTGFTRDTSGNRVYLTIPGSIPAVVISMGKNGAFAYNDDGTQIANTSSTNVDETKNGTQYTEFVSRGFAQNTDPSIGGEFDDVVSWISPYVYVSKMLAAGQLP